MIPETIIFDCEVFAKDWLFVFKNLSTQNYVCVWNDNEIVKIFLQNQPLLAGFNNAHYDNHILNCVINDYTPEQIKYVNDIIIGGREENFYFEKRYFNTYDLRSDCQKGISLKAFEAHMGMDIQETQVDFDIARSLTSEEKDLTTKYCKADVDATEQLFLLRKNYLETKITLGKQCGLSPQQSLKYTNGRLTAEYLHAELPAKPRNDERNYRYVDNLLTQYIPQCVFDFFGRVNDESIPYDDVFKSKLNINIQQCECTLGFGGIHGAINLYNEKATADRIIVNVDVASYYPHLMTLYNYTSRNIPDPGLFQKTLDKRIEAKHAGDTGTASALKLVLNTTYGCMFNQKDGVAFNKLCDPLMFRSVCITGQLFLLELAEHIVSSCQSAKIIQLNTDGVMLSIDVCEQTKLESVLKEWQNRTGFTLEQDNIKQIIQKDVNNYIEIPLEGEPKVKGGALVRGVVTNNNLELPHSWINLYSGSFNLNNNACILSKAVIDYFTKGVSPKDSVNNCNDILQFQLIAKASSKYTNCYHDVDGELIEVQRVNRVYATKNLGQKALYKKHKETKKLTKIGGLPPYCIIDNDNKCCLSDVNKDWYVKESMRLINSFLTTAKKPNTNKMKKEILSILDGTQEIMEGV